MPDRRMFTRLLASFIVLVAVDVGTASAQDQCSEDQLIWDTCTRQVCDQETVTVDDWCTGTREVCDTGTAWVPDYCTGWNYVCDTGHQWVDDYCQGSNWVCDYQRICEGGCDEWGCWESCWDEAYNCREETYSYVCGGHWEEYQYNCRWESYTYECGGHWEEYQYNCREESYQYVCGSHEETRSVNCRDEQYACNPHCPPPPPPVSGCMDPSATNYNPNATVDDGSCTYPPPDEPPATSLAMELAGGSSTMQAGSEWLKIYGDLGLSCVAEISARNAYVTVVVTIFGADEPISDMKEGFGHAKAVARLPSVWDVSPAEFECTADFTVNGRPLFPPAPRRAVSSPFWGAYVRDAFDYDVIVYFPKPGCEHSGMFQTSLTMRQPAPGYPNIARPPQYMQDEGFKLFSPGFEPFHMHFFGPRDNGALCQEAR